MTSQGHKELVEELNKLRLEISKLRDSLNELDAQKELWFTKKSESSSKIKSGIVKIKQLKLQRDQLTSEVKALKPKRDRFNYEVKQESSELKDLEKGKEQIFKDIKMKESPFRLKKELEQLEFKMETEPMAFSKEQVLMKKINQLTEKLQATKVLAVVSNKVRNTSSELRTTRKEANDIHRQIQEKAKQSQQVHEEILKTSAEIDAQKPIEQESFEKFSEYKKQFMEASSQLKEKLKAMDELRNKLGSLADEKKEIRKQQQEDFLKTKEQEVEDKIKKGGKLTTEDLLVFQNIGK